MHIIKLINVPFIAVIINVKIFPITSNSFFSQFPNQKLSIICEIIKCFISFEFNLTKAYTTLYKKKINLFSKIL